VLTASLNFAGIFSLTQLPIGVLEGALAAAMVGYLLRLETDTERRLGVPS
jgi:cobalt/nickel transport system permease protein